MIYVIMNRTTQRYYLYIGHGCHKWVADVSASSHFSLSEMFEMVADLNCMGFDVLGQVDIDSKAVEQ